MRPETSGPVTKGPPQRSDETVPIVRDTRLVPFAFCWQLRPATHHLVTVVKGTFNLVEGRPALLCDDQPPPQGDCRYGEEDKASLRYASDFAVRKPKTDVMLVGHAYPATNPSLAVVSLQVGRLQRTLAVFGDRSWGALGVPSKPTSFDKMPLRWERAMGGPLSDVNPVGRGFKTGVMLPNIERQESLVTSARDVPPPACFGPVAPEWKSRASRLGTFHKRWLGERWPYFPEDFDYSFFNAAPPEQQVPYLIGSESYALHGVRPGKQALTGTLPGLQPRVFAHLFRGGALSEIPLCLDTVWFDADDGKVVLVWRGMTTVQDDEASDISSLFVTSTTVGETLSQQQVQQRFVVASGPQKLPAEDCPVLPVQPKPIMVAKPVSRSAVMSWIETGASLQSKDLAHVDLSNSDLRGLDFSNCILLGARLDGAQLAGASLSGAVLTGVQAKGASFDACDLSGADLTDAVLVNATFRKATMSHANLFRADASGALFSEVQADEAVFAKAILTGCSFEGAQIPKGNFTDCHIEETRWAKARLDNARFYGAKGDGCSFEGASLISARMDQAVLHGADFRSALAQESVWERTDLHGASLHGATLERANFTRARLDRCVLSTANAKGAFFRKANLRASSLLKANLMQANLEGADLRDADLRGANLYQAETWRSKTQGAKLDLALLAGSKLAT